jgi:nitrate reductase gamma subunit
MRFIVPLLVVPALVLLAYLLVEQAGAHFVFTGVLPYAAVGIFLLGLIIKVIGWTRSPVPFRIPSTCGQQKTLDWIKSDYLDNPHSGFGVFLRMLLEILFFRSLFRNTKMELHDGPKLSYGANKWLWLAAIVFHYSFLVVFIRHLRFFVEPVPQPLLFLAEIDGFLQIGVPVVYITSLTLLAGVGYLLLRRMFIPQVRYISLAGDYFPLFLIIGIALTGILLRHFVKTDIIGVKEITLGLLAFKPAVPEGVHWLFYSHFLLVMVLFAYFPFSKLMHLAGVFLSPTRNLANNNRAKRHENPWNYPVEVHTYEEYEDDFREKMVKAGLPVDKPLPADEE